MTALAYDAAVPHRDALLDGAAVARALGIGPCERTHAKYRFGESLRVVHRTADGGRVAGRSFPDAAAAFARARPHATAVGRRPGVMHAPALDAVLWTFPNDRRIGALPLLAGPGPALERLLGGPCAETRLVAYAAERSATAACLDAAGRVTGFAKVHAGDGAERERRATATVYAALGTSPCLRVPRLLGGDGAALALEPLPGRRLDALAPGERADGLERLGAALATLHGLTPPPGARFDRLDPARLARAAGTIAAARPVAARAAAGLLDALRRRHPDAAGPDVCLHGDVNPRNVLLDGDRVGLIDLEDAAAGPAAADLGQLLAGLLCARVAGELAAPAAQALGGALLRGYAEIAPPPRAESLAWHTAASVMARRALTAVGRVRAADLRGLHGFLLAAEALVR